MRHYPTFHVDDDDEMAVRTAGDAPVIEIGPYGAIYIYFDSHEGFKHLYDAMSAYLVEKEEAA